jgi:hypothetical protein
LVLLSIFVSSITFFNSPFEGYLHYIVFLILLPGYYLRFGFPKAPIQLLFVPLVLGILQIFSGNNTYALFFKIFIGVLLSSTFYFYVFQDYKLDTTKLFSYYMRGSVWVSLLGIFQVFSYLVGFTPGYDYGWLLNKWSVVSGAGWGIRMNSIFSEASQCAIFLGPAAFVSLHNFIAKKDQFINKIESVIILLALFLTTSSTGYIGLFIIGLLITINYARIGNFVFAILLFAGLANLIYNNVPEFQKRVDSAIGLWVDENFAIENVNSSSFVLYNNYHIATENFKRNPIAGSGLGSHSVAFDRYSLTKLNGIIDISFNKSDANSMLLRLISETGLIGVIFFLIFIQRFYVRRPNDHMNGEAWVISNGVLVIILMYMIRQGNYFLNGFPFFMWLYYYNAMNNKNAGKLSLDQQESNIIEEDKNLPKSINSVRN